MKLHTLSKGAMAWFGVKATPLPLTFEVTHRCNLKCKYCDRHTAMPNEMTTDQALSVLDQFYGLGMRRISLDGGETLLHRDIDKIVDWLAGHGVVMVMNTNGILIPKRADVVNKLSKVKISLDGPQASHDLMRGEGAFEKALAGAHAAKQMGVGGRRRGVHLRRGQAQRWSY